MEKELLENFIVKISDLQKQINSQYEKEIKEVIEKEQSK